jgi:hypothetical protein
MRLDVGVLGAEELLCPLAAEVLDLVDHLAAAVVALARDALGVLVVEPGAERLQDGGRGEVLGGDQLERLLLAAELVVHETGHHRVGGAQVRLVGEGAACRPRGECGGGGGRLGGLGHVPASLLGTGFSLRGAGQGRSG